jgi:hypothetical protein
MSGNDITIISAIGAVVVGAGISWWFARKGTRSAEYQTSLIRGLSQRTLRESNDDNVLQPRDSTMSPDQAALERSNRDSAHPISDSAIDSYVRAALGSLLDERGQVNSGRLLRETSQNVGFSNHLAVLESLKRLRAQGAVQWDGQDLNGDATIQVLPHSST